MRCNEKTIIGKNYISLRSTKSVVEYLSEYSNGGFIEGTVVIAREQTGALGNDGKKWYSPMDGFYMAYNLKQKFPIERLYLYYYANALAVTETLTHFNVKSNVRWLNDIMVNGKKIGVIVVNTLISGVHVNSIIVGIFINLNNRVKFLPEDLRDTATSVIDETGEKVDLKEFQSVLICYINKYLNMLKKKKRENDLHIVKQWCENSGMLRKRIAISLYNGDIILGVLEGINPENGALIIRMEDSRLTEVYNIEEVKVL